MNKNVAMLLLSVVLLAMILIVINQWAFSPTQPPQSGADFSDILKKSPVVKVPDDAPGVRVAVPEGGMQGGNASAAALSAQGLAGAAGGMGQEAPGMSEVPRESAALSAAQDGAVTASPGISGGAGTSVSPAVPATSGTGEAAGGVVAKKPESKPQQPEQKVAPKPAVKPADPTPAAQAQVKTLAVNELQAVSFSAAGVLEVRAAGAFGYKVFRLKQPERIVVDITGNFGKLVNPVVKPNSMITGVRVAKHENSVRIVMDIAGHNERTWTAAQPAGNRLAVTLK
ncbi:AMIN domain-containing protein [Desulfovibrio psychrotolerans]|uniref:AMIN domain-containing protein n=1 Tax=Desulfovibrio psychrotolerans TaxID=415242 RepID=A0A7J0BR35_9BACT|nr:AMIN domain-containing protein [Desulfovibrio psychrotolerans]GFM36130.1 AMIN domain-containing protein [Desulfovibrio psychrotolerans]